MARESVNDLVAFLAVAREASFTKAAAKLGVSTSALSHTIRALEERLGLRLLTRTARSVALTEAGERLLQTAGPHFDGITDALAALTRLRDKPAGTVRISAGEHAAETILWPVLDRLLPDHPDVTVELMTDIDPEQQRVIILVEEEADEREAIAALLIEAGFEVAHAATTDEGLALLTTHKAAAALVTDAHVPGSIDGWELAQEARQRWPEMAVVVTVGEPHRQTCLSRQHSAELLLSTRAAQEHHQFACHGQRECMPMVGLDQGERQVHPGGNASRGPDLTITHIDRLGIDGEIGMLAPELVAPAPVGRHLTPAQAPGLCKDEGAGTDADQAPCLRG
jgi:DNA-binding transcriptional LysR family regulator